MILDSHTHIGKKSIIATPAELIASMDNAGIDKALVFAGKFMEKAMTDLLDDIAPYKGRLYGIGSISYDAVLNEDPVAHHKHLRKGSLYEFVENCLKTNQIYGLKFYTGYEHFYCDDEFLRPYLQLLQGYNKPAIFHTGDCYNGHKGAKLKYAHPLTIDDLATDMPNLKIVIAHIGYPFVREAAEVVYKNKNVYVDTSGFVYGNFNDTDKHNFGLVIDEYVRIAGGTDKMIFGSDWPISDQKSYVDMMRNVGLSQVEYEQIMGLRAAELFGII